MPMPPMGIVALLFFCGAGVLFMLWVLYHFVLESTRRGDISTKRVADCSAGTGAEQHEQQHEPRTGSSFEAPRIRAKAR